MTKVLPDPSQMERSQPSYPLLLFFSFFHVIVCDSKFSTLDFRANSTEIQKFDITAEQMNHPRKKILTAVEILIIMQQQKHEIADTQIKARHNRNRWICGPE